MRSNIKLQHNGIQKVNNNKIEKKKSQLLLGNSQVFQQKREGFEWRNINLNLIIILNSEQKNH